MAGHDVFIWVETSPLVWQRAADEVETFWSKVTMLHDSNGRKPFELTGHVSVNIPTSADSLGAAVKEVNSALVKVWQRIRYDHPTIASSVKYDPESERFYKVYRGIRDDNDLQHWLDTTLVRVTNHQTGVEFANSDPIAPKMPILFVIHGPVTTSSSDNVNIHLDLVLRAGHDTIDGTGAILLFGNLLRHFSDALEQGSSYPLPCFDGSEAANLSPPYRAAAGIPNSPTPAVQARLDKMNYEHVHFGQMRGSGDLPFLKLPFKRAFLNADRHQRVEMVMEGDVVTKVLAACKLAGVTITHVFHAAIPIAIRDLSEKGSEARRCNYVSDLLYNLRGFCQEPFNTSAHPVTAYHSGASKGWRVAMTIPAASSEPPNLEERKKEFSYVLSHVREYYTFVRNDTDQKYLAPYGWQGMLNTLPKAPEHPPPGPPPRDAPGATISSLGKVDAIIPQQIGRMKVSDPWVTGEEMSNGYGLFLVTHGSRMNLACAYNEAWHDKEDALDFLQRCKNLVFEFLEIDV